MRIDILTVLPQLLESPFSASIMQRAQDKGHVSIHVHNIRDYSTNKHKNVDDYQYGGGAGMVMSIEPIAALIEKLKSNSIDLQAYFSEMTILYDNKATQELNIYNRYMINIEKQYQEGTIWSQLKSWAIILEMASAIVAFIAISKQRNGETALL